MMRDTGKSCFGGRGGRRRCESPSLQERERESKGREETARRLIRPDRQIKLILRLLENVTQSYGCSKTGKYYKQGGTVVDG
jgi:hypothetical protein